MGGTQPQNEHIHIRNDGSPAASGKTEPHLYIICLPESGLAPEEIFSDISRKPLSNKVYFVKGSSCDHFVTNNLPSHQAPILPAQKKGEKFPAPFLSLLLCSTTAWIYRCRLCRGLSRFLRSFSSRLLGWKAAASSQCKCTNQRCDQSASFFHDGIPPVISIQ